MCNVTVKWSRMLPTLQFRPSKLCWLQKQVKGLLAHIKKSDNRKGSFAQLLLNSKYHKNGMSYALNVWENTCKGLSKETLPASAHYYTVVIVMFVQHFSLIYSSLLFFNSKKTRLSLCETACKALSSTKICVDQFLRLLACRH